MEFDNRHDLVALLLLESHAKSINHPEELEVELECRGVIRVGRCRNGGLRIRVHREALRAWVVEVHLANRLDLGVLLSLQDMAWRGRYE